jgi:hypothetical protein
VREWIFSVLHIAEMHLKSGGFPGVGAAGGQDVVEAQVVALGFPGGNGLVQRF